MSNDKASWIALAALRFKPITQFKSLFATPDPSLSVILKERSDRRISLGVNSVKGNPLDAAQRADMEELLGCDFRDVRIYDDHQAGEIARQLNAEAFTVGNKIFAAEGKLNTATLGGKALLAHELAHVAQQTQQSSWAGAERTLSHRGVSQGIANGEIAQVATSSPTGASGSLVQQAMEAEAQAVEHSVQEANNTMSKRAERSNPKAVEINAEDIADRVYHLMQYELILEKERARV